MYGVLKSSPGWHTAAATRPRSPVRLVAAASAASAASAAAAAAVAAWVLAAVAARVLWPRRRRRLWLCSALFVSASWARLCSAAVAAAVAATRSFCRLAITRAHV